MSDSNKILTLKHNLLWIRCGYDMFQIIMWITYDDKIYEQSFWHIMIFNQRRIVEKLPKKNQNPTNKQTL